MIKPENQIKLSGNGDPVRIKMPCNNTWHKQTGKAWATKNPTIMSVILNKWPKPWNQINVHKNDLKHDK